MSVARFVGAAVLAGVACSMAASAQPFRPCIDPDVENTAQQQRRQEGLNAARIINSVVSASVSRPGRDLMYPTWEELADSTAARVLRVPGGKPMRDTAAKMVWGTDEPLPGWRIHYVAGRDKGYAFSLVDVRDRCEFGFVSDETGVIAETHTLRLGGAQVIPLGTR